MNKKNAKVKIPTRDAAHQAEVLRRYQVGTSVRGAVITAVEVVGSVVIVAFQAAADMLLVVFGSFQDASYQQFRPSLIVG